MFSSDHAANSREFLNRQQLLADFPVGGLDPDFVVGSAKPKVCSLPFVGKFLPQCK